MDQSILYVDIENLQDIAKQALIAAIGNWPEDFPKPMAVKLYVKADQTELWNIWASHNIPAVEVNIKGVQHYTFNGSKNSADISLGLDALADFLKGRTKHIAVLSDDSDYISLFAAIKQDGNEENPRTLFKWFMTDRPDTRSQMLIDFFPAEYIHTVNSSSTEIPIEHAPKAISEKESFKNTFSEEQQIARSIMQNIQVGLFKSSDCKKIIVKNFPNHPLAKADSAKFGILFSKDIWPFLQEFGVLLPNPNRKPRKYEMTQDAKNKAG